MIGARAVFRHVADAGFRILNATPLRRAGRHRRGRRPRRLQLRRAAHRHPRRRKRRRDARRRARPQASRPRVAPSPGTGALLAALEYATERTARTVGKPDPQIFEAALDRLGDGRTLVVGDRLDADLAGAAAAGLDGAIVLQRRHDPRAGRGRARIRRPWRSPATCDARARGPVMLADRQPGVGRRARRAGAARRGGCAPHATGSSTTSSARAASITLASWRWRPQQRGEMAVAFGGDGLVRRVATALSAHRRASSACCRAGAATTSRACSGSRRTRRRRARSWPTAASRRSISARLVGLGVGDVRRRSPAAASTRRPTGSPTRPGWSAGNFVYTYGGLRALLGWRPAAFELDARRRAPDAARGYTVAVANSATYGGGMLLAPGRLARRRPVRRRDDRGRLPSSSSCGACCRPCSGARTCGCADVEVLRAREVEMQRSRPFTMYADGDPIAELPVTVTLPAGSGQRDRARNEKHERAPSEDRRRARRR